MAELYFKDHNTAMGSWIFSLNIMHSYIQFGGGENMLNKELLQDKSISIDYHPIAKYTYQTEVPHILY